MTRENAIDQAIKLAGRGVLIVATTDENGVPHVAAAGAVTKPEPGQVAVTEWFCPGTVANAAAGRSVSVVGWDPAHDLGHQIIGRVRAVEEVAMLDGYEPTQDRQSPIPQVERRLIIDVDKVLAFRKAPHSDVEE